jgi:hypothetical protein
MCVLVVVYTLLGCVVAIGYSLFFCLFFFFFFFFLLSLFSTWEGEGVG